MDFSGLTEHFVLIVVLACLVVGYIIKHASFLKWISNDDIPCILAVLGAIVNCIASGLSLESIIFGGVMGLASTGLHQAFTKFIEKNTNTEESNTNVNT